MVVSVALLLRAFGALGLTEAVMAMSAFTRVLVAGGSSWGDAPSAALLTTASGTAFAAIAFGQVANAFACRSTVTPVWRLRVMSNPQVLAAVLVQLVLLAVLLGFAPLAGLLGGSWLSSTGWLAEAATAALVVAVDGLVKAAR
jgi:magnesium-transporting ATPase (P-type)